MRKKPNCGPGSKECKGQCIPKSWTCREENVKESVETKSVPNKELLLIGGISLAAAGAIGVLLATRRGAVVEMPGGERAVVPRLPLDSNFITPYTEDGIYIKDLNNRPDVEEVQGLLENYDRIPPKEPITPGLQVNTHNIDSLNLNDQERKKIREFYQNERHLNEELEPYLAKKILDISTPVNPALMDPSVRSKEQNKVIAQNWAVDFLSEEVPEKLIFDIETSDLLPLSASEIDEIKSNKLRELSPAEKQARIKSDLKMPQLLQIAAISPSGSYYNAYGVMREGTSLKAESINLLHKDESFYRENGVDQVDLYKNFFEFAKGKEAYAFNGRAFDHIYLDKFADLHDLPRIQWSNREDLYEKEYDPMYYLAIYNNRKVKQIKELEPSQGTLDLRRKLTSTDYFAYEPLPGGTGAHDAFVDVANTMNAIIKMAKGEEVRARKISPMTPFSNL